MFLFETQDNNLDQLEQSGFKEFVKCDLSNVNLRLADLSGTILFGVNLEELNLDGIVGTDLNGTKTFQRSPWKIHP